MKRIAAAVCLASLTLAGCGFTPMYSNFDTAEMGSIQIAEIEGYTGHAMRRELLMQLRPGLPGVESGVLVVETKEAVQNFDFTVTGTTSRTRVTLTAEYTLTTPGFADFLGRYTLTSADGRLGAHGHGGGGGVPSGCGCP